MQKKFALATALAVAFAAVPAMALPTADEIMSTYMEKSGIKANGGKIKNRVTKGTFSLPDMGMSGPTEIYVQPPNMYNKIVFDAFGEVKRGVTGDTVWSLDPMQGARIVEGEEADGQKRQAGFDQFANWKTDYAKVEVAEEADLEGTKAFKVVFTPKEGAATTIFFAKDSGLPVRMEQQTPDGMTGATLLSDYKAVDGIQLAHKLRIEGGQMTFEMVYESIQHNTDIPAGTFDLPEEIKALKNPPAPAAAPKADAPKADATKPADTPKKP
ncbi:MAG: hypothetical protein AAB353_14420 [Candidatus Hydrogenedentota bacterium]